MIDIKRVTHLDADSVLVEQRYKGGCFTQHRIGKRYFVWLDDGQISWRVRVWPQVEC